MPDAILERPLAGPEVQLCLRQQLSRSTGPSHDLGAVAYVRGKKRRAGGHALEQDYGGALDVRRKEKQVSGQVGRDRIPAGERTHEDRLASPLKLRGVVQRVCGFQTARPAPPLGLVADDQQGRVGDIGAAEDLHRVPVPF